MRSDIVKCKTMMEQNTIYLDYKKGDFKTKKELAKKYGVSTRTLGRIITHVQKEMEHANLSDTPEVVVEDVSYEYDYTVTQNEISIFKNGEPRTITKTFPDFNKLKKKLIKGEFSDKVLRKVYDKMDMESFLEEFTQGRLTVDHESGSIRYGTFPVEHELVELIMGGLDSGNKDKVLPLIKFLENLIQNPKEGVVKELYPFLKYNDITITRDGLIQAWKGVRDDFYDKYTGTIYNGVGETIVMPRTEVNDNPNQTCSHGLHVAAKQYAQNWGSKLLKVIINPKNVVSVPTDYNGQKMRCCEYFVVSEA